MQVNMTVTHVLVYSSVRSDQIVVHFTTSFVDSHFVLNVAGRSGMTHANRHFPNVPVDFMDVDR